MLEAVLDFLDRFERCDFLAEFRVIYDGSYSLLSFDLEITYPLIVISISTFGSFFSTVSRKILARCIASSRAQWNPFYSDLMS